MMPVFRPHSSANIERIEFAKKLVNLLRDRNMNQADLARKSGLTRDAISTYTRARSMPEPANMEKIATALGVEPAYFQLDANRLAERMGSPEPFDSRAVPPAMNEEQFTMTVLPNDKAFVRVAAIIDLDKATELLAFFRKKGV